MYNVSAVYEVVGRILDGTYVTAYMIRDRRNNETNILSKQVVEQLALNKQIYNCSAQIYKNIVNMKGINCKLSALPKFDTQGNRIIDETPVKHKTVADLRLIGKIQKGRTIQSYVVASVHDNTRQAVLPRDTVLQLARSGRIINAKSQMNGDTVVLRGDNGFNLSQLQTYTTDV